MRIQSFKHSTLEAVQQLLKLGAEVDIRDKWHITPLMLAVDNPTTTVCNLLLDHGADIHARDVFGWTPLHWAVSWTFRDVHVVRNLLDQGADPHVSAWDKCTDKYSGSWVTLNAAQRLYINLCYLDLENAFYNAFPDAYVDDQGDVFWNAPEYNSSGYGTSIEMPLKFRLWEEPGYLPFRKWPIFPSPLDHQDCHSQSLSSRS